jgi:hypothetical protein
MPPAVNTRLHMRSAVRHRLPAALPHPFDLGAGRDGRRRRGDTQDGGAPSSSASTSDKKPQGTSLRHWVYTRYTAQENSSSFEVASSQAQCSKKLLKTDYGCCCYVSPTTNTHPQYRHHCDGKTVIITQRQHGRARARVMVDQVHPRHQPCTPTRGQ